MDDVLYGTILELRSIERGRIIDGVEELLLQTDSGAIVARYHEAFQEDGKTPRGDAAVLWVGGAGGGLDGPAGGLYPRLAAELVQHGGASLRIHYRRPNDLVACIFDTLLGLEYLKTCSRTRIALVGHSFGGAVVISAGAVSQHVVAVAALSSQTYGTTHVEDVSPRPLLLMHGTDDEVLPDTCAHDIYQRGGEPKELILYPGCSHGLDECRSKVDRDLMEWLQRVLLDEG